MTLTPAEVAEVRRLLSHGRGPHVPPALFDRVRAIFAPRSPATAAVQPRDEDRTPPCDLSPF